jgi:hypothetical protein
VCALHGACFLHALRCAGEAGHTPKPADSPLRCTQPLSLILKAAMDTSRVIDTLTIVRLWMGQARIALHQAPDEPLDVGPGRAVV